MISKENRLREPGYQRAYRMVGYCCIGFVILVFSVALSRSLGVVGLILPSLLIGAAYVVVSFLLDVLIYVLELRNGKRDIR
jgi:hypothetical protein